MLMFVLVSMLSCINTVICDDYTQSIHSVTVNVTYYDPMTGMTRSESDGSGHYGLLSRVVGEYGVVVHIRTSDVQGCIPQMTMPSEKWIALVDRGLCRTTNQKVQNLPAIRNASAIVIYSGEDDADLDNIPPKSKKGKFLIHVCVMNHHVEKSITFYKCLCFIYL